MKLNSLKFALASIILAGLGASVAQSCEPARLQLIGRRQPQWASVTKRLAPGEVPKMAELYQAEVRLIGQDIIQDEITRLIAPCQTTPNPARPAAITERVYDMIFPRVTEFSIHPSRTPLGALVQNANMIIYSSKRNISAEPTITIRDLRVAVRCCASALRKSQRRIADMLSRDRGIMSSILLKAPVPAGLTGIRDFYIESAADYVRDCSRDPSLGLEETRISSTLLVDAVRTPEFLTELFRFLFINPISGDSSTMDVFEFSDKTLDISHGIRSDVLAMYRAAAK